MHIGREGGWGGGRGAERRNYRRLATILVFAEEEPGDLILKNN